MSVKLVLESFHRGTGIQTTVSQSTIERHWIPAFAGMTKQFYGGYNASNIA
jgi:hypothetical protein